MNSSKMLLTVLAFCLAAGAASAIALGDPAPPLAVSEWVKGDAVNLADGKDKNIYVVEFWATWCGPCKASIPHLTELQAKYKDKGVIVAGISSEDAATVKPFVSEMGDKMAYSVGVDDAQKTSDAYMKAFSVSGIPHAFVVDKAGNIVWHGHPMDNLEKVLDGVIAGSFNPAKQAEAAKAKALIPVYMYLVNNTSETDLALEVCKRAAKYGANDTESLSQLAILIASKDGAAAEELAVALDAAKRAEELGGGKDAQALAARAYVAFAMNQADEAIRYQEQAIAITEDPDMKAELQNQLEAFREKASAP